MDFYSFGVQAAFDKFAFDPEAAQKVLALAKARQLPKASGRLVPTLAGMPGLKQHRSDTAGVHKKLTEALGPSTGKFLAAQAQQQTDATVPGRILQQTGKPTIYPGRGSIRDQFNSAVGDAFGAPPTVPAEQRKMLHSILKGHELDESSVSSRMGAAQFGHRSPDVIFREHNRVVTLPPGNAQVQAFMKHYRDPKIPELQAIDISPRLRESTLFPTNLTYGESPRLSRHARKHLINRAERNVLGPLIEHKDEIAKSIREESL